MKFQCLMSVAVENTYFSQSFLVLKLLFTFWTDQYFLQMLQFGWRRKPRSSCIFAFGCDVMIQCFSGTGGTWITPNLKEGHEVRGLVFQSWLCFQLAA